jgi:hypothetical protein
MTTDLSGDIENDLEALILVLGHFQEAYADFDAEPHIDEVGELSMWTRELMAFFDKLENEYGSRKAKAILARAWEEVKSG